MNLDVHISSYLESFDTTKLNVSKIQWTCNSSFKINSLYSCEIFAKNFKCRYTNLIPYYKKHYHKYLIILISKILFRKKEIFCPIKSAYLETTMQDCHYSKKKLDGKLIVVVFTSRYLLYQKENTFTLIDLRMQKYVWLKTGIVYVFCRVSLIKITLIINNS